MEDMSYPDHPYLITDDIHLPPTKEIHEYQNTNRSELLTNDIIMAMIFSALDDLIKLNSTDYTNFNARSGQLSEPRALG